MTLLAAARVVAPVFPLVLQKSGVSLRDERAGDVAARERLLDASFGPSRFEKTCERLREGREAARGLALVAKDGEALVGTLRFWHVEAGGAPALLLGPLAVAQSHRELGLGGALMRMGLDRAESLGHKAVMLVGDEPYYSRFGFARAPMQGLDLPGWYDPARFLGLELETGALAQARGMVVATGAMERRRISRAA
jgi:predicted N-acetyltransferase YhbS